MPDRITQGLAVPGGASLLKLSHVSLTARDADELSAFYIAVFGVIERRPSMRLSGKAVWRGNGLPGVDITSVWLDLPGAQGPFLEILAYDKTSDRPVPAVNDPGLGHLAFEVRDIHATVDSVLRSGGAMQGEVTNFGTDDAPCLIVYMRDPEGNILELEQGLPCPAPRQGGPE